MEIARTNPTSEVADDPAALHKSNFPPRTSLGAILTIAALTPIILGAKSSALAQAEQAISSPVDSPPPTLVLDAKTLAQHDSTLFTIEKDGSSYQIDTSQAVAPHSLPSDSLPPAKPLKDAPRGAVQGVIEYVVKGGAAALGCLGAIGAIRGTIKAGDYVLGRLEDREKFIGRECLETPSCNFHVLKEKDGKLALDIGSIDKPELDDIFRNGYAQRVFTKALELCTPDQPFPSLNFDKARSKLIEEKVRVLKGKENESPILLLEEINKLLRDSYSALYGEGIVAHGMELPVKRDVHVLIPICEVSSTGERDVVFAAISQSDFNRCAGMQSGTNVAKDSQQSRLAQLGAAYAQQQAFKDKYSCELFPTIVVFIKV